MCRLLPSRIILFGFADWPARVQFVRFTICSSSRVEVAICDLKDRLRA
jgi:hypothetical protein